MRLLACEDIYDIFQFFDSAPRIGSDRAKFVK